MKKVVLFLCCILFVVISVLGFDKEKLFFFPEFIYTNVEAMTDGESTQGGGRKNFKPNSRRRDRNCRWGEVESKIYRHEDSGLYRKRNNLL